MRKATEFGKIAASVAVVALAAAGSAGAQSVSETDDDELDLISLDSLPEPEPEAYDDLDEFDATLGPETAPRQTDLEELRASFELYKSALANGSYDEADTLAKRMVELAIRIYGLDSHEASKALTNLGLVQQKNKDYESAILNFEAAIDIIERIEDRLHSELINPLRGRGAAELGAGRPDLAQQSFSRAVHVSHVNEGPHNLMQIDMLEELAETYLAMGDRDEALDMHEYIYNIEARNTDLESEDILPALERQADWLHRMSLYDKERMTWRRIISILEDTRGKRDISLIAPLTGLAKSYLYVSEFSGDYYAETSLSSGDGYLKRAVRIAEESPDSNWAILNNALLSLADYYTLSARASKAKRIYGLSWNLLSQDDDAERLAIRADELEKTRILQPIAPPKYYNSVRTEDGQDPPDSFVTGTIVAGYRVSPRGSTRDIEIIDSDPQGLEDMEYSVARELRRMVHRPRMENGELVETSGKSYTHEFYYRPSDVPTIEDAEPEDETVASEGS